MLALLLAVSKDELEADFAQYYGLDLGRMGVDYTISHAAVLASQLPPHARCFVKLNPDLAWSDERMLLERLDYHLQHLTWMLSKDAQQGTNRPEPPETPSEAANRAKRIREAEVNRATVDRILGVRPV